jgi:hypothetical protein
MTFPTRTDLAFYQSKQRLPAWTGRIAVKSPMRNPIEHALIDDVINAHAGVNGTAGEMSAANLCSLVRSFRRRGADLTEELQKLVVQPGCVIHPEKRAAFARKWTRRLMAEASRGAS